MVRGRTRFLPRETAVYPAEHGNRQPAAIGGRGDECGSEHGCAVTSASGRGLSVWVCCVLFVVRTFGIVLGKPRLSP